jgi:tripartite ATP-independent transporter DctM subunit
MAIGIPIFFAMLISSLVALFYQGELSLMIIPQRMFAIIDSFSLLAIPFFVLAGVFMETGGISARLVGFAGALVGHFRAGLCHVTVVSAMIFAGVSGSATADTSAIGAIVIPAMIKSGYKKGFVAALLASAGAIGPIIPPSLIMIVYGSMTGVSIAAMFLGGFIPGVIIGLGLMVVCYLWRSQTLMARAPRATLREVVRRFVDAFWALVSPVIILGGIVFGVFTPTEAGVVAAVYALLVGLFIYREFRVRDIPAMLVRAAITTTIVMSIIAAAGVFGWLLASEQMPSIVARWMNGVTDSPALKMLLIQLFLLVLGCFVEGLAAAIILIPVLHPLALQMGLDPVHFAVVVCINIIVGGVTPPVGVLLYVSSSIAQTTLEDASRYVLPFLVVLVGVIMATAYIPSLVTFLPRLVLR